MPWRLSEGAVIGFVAISVRGGGSSSRSSRSSSRSSRSSSSSCSFFEVRDFQPKEVGKRMAERLGSFLGFS